MKHDEAIRLQTSVSTPQKVYLWLTAVFVASLLIADITGVKLFEINVAGRDVKHTCGMLTFPVTFLLTDLINEYFGRRAARRVVWIGFAMGLLVFLVVSVALAMPRWEVGFNIKPGSFEDVFANSRQMYLASLAAFLVGSMSDIYLFGVLKRATGGRMVWLRATGSTVASQAVDSFVVTYLAFHVFKAGTPEQAPMGTVVSMAATGYTLKFVIALALTPVIYLGRWVMHRWLGLVPLPVGV